MKIRLIEPVASGAPFVAPVLIRRLHSLPKDPTGSHTLSALGVSIGVAVDIGSTIGTPPEGAEISLRATGGSGVFPVFHGTLRVEAVDTFSSRLVLAGTYQVPLGALGAVADRTILAGTAKRSLRALLTDVRSEVAASVIAGISGA